MSDRSSGRESLLHAMCWNVFAWLGVSLSRPVLKSVSSFGRWGFSPTYPVLESVCRTSSGESILHALSWHLSRRSLGGKVVLHAECCSLSHREAGRDFLLHTPVLESVLSFVGRGVTLTRPVLVSVSSNVGGGFLLYALWWNLCDRSADRGSLLTPRARICLVVRRVGSFSYTPRAQICLVVRRVESLSHTLCTRNWLISRVVDSLCQAPRIKFCLVVC